VQLNENEIIAEKLDTLIRLVCIALVENKIQKDQIRLLTLAGMGPSRIAALLGTTANTVKVAISNMRKGKTLPGRK
jgi:tRNA A22 N-methylase